MAKPAASSRLLTSRYGNGLSCTDLNLDLLYVREDRRARFFKVEGKCFLQVFESLFTTFSLTGYIDFQALSNVDSIFFD